MSNHQDDSRPPPAGSRSLRESEKPLWEPREAFANEKNRFGSLAKPSRMRKIDSAGSRSLRKREKSIRRAREARRSGGLVIDLFQIGIKDLSLRSQMTYPVARPQSEQRQC